MRDDCIEWEGSKHNHGYGRFRKGTAGRPGFIAEYAHRKAWKDRHGPIPEGMQVLHHCDNPPCVNTDHLFLGTQADNMRDMAAKGRGRSGSKKWSHCKNGHPLTPLGKNGKRQCRICRKAYNHRYRKEIREGIRVAPPCRVRRTESVYP